MGDGYVLRIWYRAQETENHTCTTGGTKAGSGSKTAGLSLARVVAVRGAGKWAPGGATPCGRPGKLSLNKKAYRLLWLSRAHMLVLRTG